MRITKIQISQLPNEQPITFVDELEFKNVYLDTTESNTDIETTDWDGEKNIPVFSRVHDAYTFQLFARNDLYNALQKARYAGSVVITLENNTTHNAFITAIESENQEGTFFKLINIQYYDKDSVRYVNHHDYITFPDLLNTPNTELKLKNVDNLDGVTDKSIDTNWDNIVNVSKEYIRNSNFKPLLITDKRDDESDEETGTKRENSIFYRSQVLFRGYYDRITANNLYRYLKIANRITITYDGTTYQLTESTDADVSEIGKDCFLVEFQGVYENNEFYYY